VLGVVLPSILVYIIIFPISVVLMLRTRYHKLDTLKVQSVFGMICKGFKKAYYYFEVQKLYLRAILVLVVYALDDYNVAKGNIQIMLLIIYYVKLVRNKPYQGLTTFVLDQYLTLALMLSLSLVILSIGLSNDFATFILTLMIYLVNGLLLLRLCYLIFEANILPVVAKMNIKYRKYFKVHTQYFRIFYLW
jgi:hypothetical protein